MIRDQRDNHTIFTKNLSFITKNRFSDIQDPKLYFLGADFKCVCDEVGWGLHL